MAIFNQNRLGMLNSDDLALLLATPTPSQKTQRKHIRLKPRASPTDTNIKNTPMFTIPQKRQKTIKEEKEIYEFRANRLKSIISSTTQSNSIRFNRFIPANTPAFNIFDMANIADIKTIIQNAINPLVDEIRGLKEEIQQLKIGKANAVEITVKEPKAVLISALKQKQTQAKTLTEKTNTAAIELIAKKPTYADIAAGEQKQTTEKAVKP